SPRRITSSVQARMRVGSRREMPTHNPPQASPGVQYVLCDACGGLCVGISLRLPTRILAWTLLVIRRGDLPDSVPGRDRGSAVYVLGLATRDPTHVCV